MFSKLKNLFLRAYNHPKTRKRLALGVVFASLGDLLTTILCIKIFPEVFTEGNSIPACMIEKQGLWLGLGFCWVTYMSIVVLLYYTTIPKKVVYGGLLFWGLMSFTMFVRNGTLLIMQALGVL